MDLHLFLEDGLHRFVDHSRVKQGADDQLRSPDDLVLAVELPEAGGEQVVHRLERQPHVGRIVAVVCYHLDQVDLKSKFQ